MAIIHSLSVSAPQPSLCSITQAQVRCLCLVDSEVKALQEAPGLTPEMLGIPDPKALFPVCLTAEQWYTPESFYSPVHVESVLPVSV